jgi:hypothetical protein
VRQVLRQAADNAQAYAARGWIHLHQGQVESALRDFKLSLQQEPDGDWAKQGLMAALQRKNPLNFLHSVNPYGRSLFSPEQIQANRWLMALPGVAIALGFAAATGNVWLALSSVGLYGISFLVVRACCTGDRWIKVRSLLAAFWVTLGAVSLGYAYHSYPAHALPLLLSSAAGMLTYFCVRSYSQTNPFFKVSAIVAAVLAFLGAGLLLLSLLLSPNLENPGLVSTVLIATAKTLGVLTVKVALAIFITTELGRLQY